MAHQPLPPPKPAVIAVEESQMDTSNKTAKTPEETLDEMVDRINKLCFGVKEKRAGLSIRFPTQKGEGKPAPTDE